MTHPTIIDYWQAVRDGDPDAIAALDLARAACIEQDEMLARTIKAECQAEHLGKVIASASNALKHGNAAGAAHVLDHAYDGRTDDL